MAQRFPHLYLIGLTGNIGCGKSTVAALLRERGAQVIDADQVTRQVMAVDQPAYNAIVQTFGAAILHENRAIDRPALGRIVFGDRDKLRALEAIVHPATRAAIMAWLDDRDAEAAHTSVRQIAVVDAIRLIEAGYPAFCDAVWVVTCDEAEQVRRLVHERGMREADARQRIAAQPPQSEKVTVADVVIDNSGTLEQTHRQIDAAWQAVARTISDQSDVYRNVSEERGAS